MIYLQTLILQDIKVTQLSATSVIVVGRDEGAMWKPVGTLVSGFAVLCGYPTHYDTKREGVCWNIVAAVLQVILTPIIVGLIWSVQRGVIIVQESLQKKIDERDEKAEEIA
ncbi:putative Ectodermal ciliogenesis protein-containing protein [Homarus americanus]|uniref:Putative Ectodermal ciliogenesis protein-containing protein n=1 Tax=Homarus americanus TaxID=6706 RepID=A0A8J5TIN3_HOMAM|nr:putative Ectodermal ciliogenesis protein-containing protein [Homarus americanus]